jgi:cell division protein FtsL
LCLGYFCEKVTEIQNSNNKKKISMTRRLSKATASFTSSHKVFLIVLPTVFLTTI